MIPDFILLNTYRNSIVLTNIILVYYSVILYLYVNKESPPE